MQRSKKSSKRVSWASGLTLCQVKLFKSEDPPSQVGQRPHNKLKEETPRIVLMKWRCPPKVVLNPKWQVAAGEESKEVEVQNQRVEQVLEAIYPHPSHVPPRPFVAPEAKGCYYDDSRTPVIPTDPIEEEVEEEAAGAPMHFVEPTEIPAVPEPYLVPQLCHGSTLAAARPAINENAASEVVSSFGNLIDLDLLMKILSDPTVCETLITEFGKQSSSEPATKQSSLPMNFPVVRHSCPASANTNIVGVHIPSSVAAPTNQISQSSLPALVAPPLLKDKGEAKLGKQSDVGPAPEQRRSPPVHLIDPHSCPVPTSISGIQIGTPSSAAPLATNAVTSMSGPNPPSHGSPQMSVPAVNSLPPLKDMSYYKSLIQQHGAEKPKPKDQNNLQMGNSLNHPQWQPKVELALKSKRQNSNMNLPHKTYNGSKRYRNGSNSEYKYNMPFQYHPSTIIPEVHYAKRMKPSWELTGST